jgi:hypothetical protein
MRTLARLAALFGGLASAPGAQPRLGAERRYYDPGANPFPRKATGNIYPIGTRKKSRRVPRAVRLQIMREHGVERPSGRQWRMLRKELRIETRQAGAR